MKGRNKSARGNRGVVVMPLALGETAEGGHVGRCDNLCAEPDGVMRLAPQLCVTHGRSLRPLAQYCHIDGSVTMLYCGASDIPDVSVLVAGRDGDFADIGRVDGAVSCALARREGFLVATPRGMVRVDYDEEAGVWHVADRIPEPPPVAVRALGCGSVWEATGAVTLRHVGQSAGSYSVPDSELKSFTGVVLESYDRLVAATSEAGLWIQPVLVRYRIYSDSGELLYTSAPVLVAPYRWQCREPMVSGFTYADSTLSVPSMRIEAETFRVEVVLPDDDGFGLWSSVAARIEVSVSPQFHPVDFDGMVSCRFSRVGSPQAAVSVLMPGADRPQSYYSRIIPKAIDCGESIEIAALRIDAPFSAGVHTVICSAGATASSQSAILGRQIASRAYPVASSVWEFMTPHSFTAAAVCADGDAVVWGDVTPIYSAGYSITEMASGFYDTAWKAVVRVTMRTGDTVTGSFGGYTDMPASLGPMVSYPHSQAVNMEVYVTDSVSGRVRRASLPLQSLPGAGMAVWIGDSLDSVALEEWSGAVPEVSPLYGRRHTGLLMSASLDAPLQPVSSLRCSHSPVAALLPACGSRSSWNSSRGRIYAFCADGVYNITLDSCRRLMSASCVDVRGVTSDRCVADTPIGTMMLSGGSLVKLSGTRAVTLLDGLDAAGLGWDYCRSRLWLLDRRGNTDLYNPDSGSMCRVLTPVCAETVHSVGTKLIFDTGTCVLEPCDVTEEVRPVAWQGNVAVHGRLRVAAVEIGVTASYFSGHMRVTGHNGDYALGGAVLMSAAVEGVLQSPVAARIIAPVMRYVAVEVSGETSGDFCIRYINLKFTR